MRTLKRYSSLTKAMQSSTPTLSLLVRTMSEKQIEAYIKLWLINLNENLDLKKPLNEGQIDTIAFRIVENYRSLNLADINLVFKNAEMGKYGDTYDRISVPTVLKWFKDYFNDRCNMASEISYQNHVQHKAAFSDASRGSENTPRETMAKLQEKYQKDIEMTATKKRVAKAQKKVQQEN